MRTSVALLLVTLTVLPASGAKWIGEFTGAGVGTASIVVTGTMRSGGRVVRGGRWRCPKCPESLRSVPIRISCFFGPIATVGAGAAQCTMLGSAGSTCDGGFSYVAGSLGCLSMGTTRVWLRRVH